MNLHAILHILEHALVDSAKALPFLFLAYLLMEAAEHYHSAKMEKAIRGIGKAARWWARPWAVSLSAAFLPVPPTCLPPVF